MLKDLNIQIPTVNKRDRIPMSAIQTVVDFIAQTFDPEKIILFGSYAYGNPKPWSDVDLLVVLDTENPKQAQMDINLSFIDPIGLDILVRTPQELARRIPLGDNFLKDVVTKGKVLYERTHPRVASKS